MCLEQEGSTGSEAEPQLPQGEVGSAWPPVLWYSERDLQFINEFIKYVASKSKNESQTERSGS